MTAPQAGLMLAFSAAIALVTATQGATPQSRPAVEVTGNWSGAIQGVRGRLIATLVEDAGRPQIRLELELRNEDEVANPIGIWWTGFSSMLDLSLEDEAGVALPKLHMAGNELRPLPFWLELLHDSSMRIAISNSAVQEAAPNRVFLRPTAFQGWTLPGTRTSKLYLSGKLTPRPSPEKRLRAWTGPLVLPRVALP